MPPPSLSYDEVDDLIYFSRTGDLSSLKELIQSLSQKHSLSAPAIYQAAIDVDEEGLGSKSCLLHYPAANGNLAIVQYLLGQDGLARNSNDEGHLEGVTDDARATALKDFVNHKNVSGNTPLHWAGMNGHLEIVKALVKAGADPEIINEAGRDAVVESEWSSKPGAEECAVWILKECGALEKGVGEEGQENGTQNGGSGDVDVEDHSNDKDVMNTENGFTDEQDTGSSSKHPG